jgi:hypothetical protein
MSKILSVLCDGTVAAEKPKTKIGEFFDFSEAEKTTNRTILEHL